MTYEKLAESAIEVAATNIAASFQAAEASGIFGAVEKEARIIRALHPDAERNCSWAANYFELQVIAVMLLQIGGVALLEQYDIAQQQLKNQLDA